MRTHSQPLRSLINGERVGQIAPLNYNGNTDLRQQDVLRRLQEALRYGMSVTGTLWVFSTMDWVAAVQATDVDNDGDIEIVVGSRDGYVRVLTRRGAVKWQKLLEGYHVSALFVIPFTETTMSNQARIIVGTREGKVLALDEYGEQVKDWEYQTGRMIRQIYISAQTPNNVIIGSEDRCIHILDSATGKPLCNKYRTEGWVRCVFSCDIDGDGKDEILAGSGDRYLYILDDRGTFLKRFFIGHQVYALYAAPLNGEKPVHIITSSNRKDLTAWKITRQRKRLNCKKEWEKTTKDNLFENRVHSICIADVNGDKKPEILVGSEDGYLYILDHAGTLLWKHHFDSCIYRVDAADIDYDDQIEILIGTEDNRVHAIHLEMEHTKDLYKHIRETYHDAIHEYNYRHSDIIKILTHREKVLLKDFTNDGPQLHHPQMEMEDAIHWMAKREYEKALAIFLRLLQQKVQYYWAHPIRTKGYIWSECFANVYDGPTSEILVGTDEGNITAFNIEKNGDKQLWSTSLDDRVRMIQTGITGAKSYDSIVAVLANHRLVILDHSGEVIKEHTFEDKQDWARCVSVRKADSRTGTESEIVIGLENKKVSIWDAKLEHQITEIPTPQGINMVYIHDITGSGTTEIVSGSVGNQVYVHTREGEELWRFETQGSVEALHVEDIDKDGHAEIIVGTEDRYVYVLDHEGHLKWRYRTMRGVMDVDVCDIKLENDPDDEKERTWKVLVSSNDSYLYMLNAEGDLIWKYKCNNRVRAVRAGDINRDSKFEIAIASENQLELLQILNRNELVDHIQHCWQELLNIDNPGDHHAAIIKLTRHGDEYIRAFALAKLAGQHARYDEDFKRFQEALKDDDSLQVKKELVRAIAVLYLVPEHRDENKRQARQLLQQLSNAPEQEIKLAILDILPLLITAEEKLGFDTLEDFNRSADVWVRYAVVRKLDKLFTTHPERTLAVLMNTVNDADEWIRQESGRVLAHYFDAYPQLLVRDMLAFLYKRTDPEVFKQISYSAKAPAVKRLFAILVRLLTHIDARNLKEVLDEATAAIVDANTLWPLYGEELLQIYEEFRALLQTKTMSAIARYQRVTRSDTLSDVSISATSSARQIMQVFDALERVVQAVKKYERREAMGDRATSLIDAADILDAIRSDLREAEMRQTHKLGDTYRLPENVILTLLLEQWAKVIKEELYRLRGAARLVAEIRNKVAQLEEEVVISLLISNTGRSPADNVHVVLEKSPDFTILGNDEQTLVEVSTSTPVSIDFKIRPAAASLRLSFRLIYDDAEGRGKRADFADVVTIRGQHRPYRQIPNPYTSGMPIRDQKMFYGRKEDLEALQEKLSGSTANKVVVLAGQRRMGKTSLIYRLAYELSQGPYVPVLIDLQSLALISNDAQFLQGLASRIHDEVLHYRDVHVPELEAEAFRANATAAFNEYLDAVLQALPRQKLVLLLDEFERLEEHLQQGKLKQDILYYLRSLMQHHRDLNFLLAGSPRIRHLIEGYWSIFFNIALQHFLTGLKSEEAIDLITEPIAEYLEYDPLALEKVQRLTGNRPYLIHVLSERLIAYCNKQKKTYVTINDMNVVLDLLLEEQASSIRWIWDEPSHVERFILSILAQEKGEEGRAFSLNDIRAEYEAQGIPFSNKEVSEALKKLVESDIVEEKLDGKQFRIPVGLIKEWLRRAKPPERVAREELLNDD